MEKIYELKPNVSVDDLLEIGFFKLPFEIVGNDLVLAKMITFPREHELVNQAINNVFNNEEWQNIVFNEEGTKEYLESIDILFESYIDENGNEKFLVVENQELIDLICNWRLEFNLSDDDKWLGFTTSDIITNNVYFNINILNNYCLNEINQLLEKDFIQIKEV